MFGVIGLGQMGGSIARKLLAGGADLMVFDIDPEAVAASGCQQVASSPAELAARCNLILVVVLTDQQTQAVVAGADGILSGLSGGQSGAPSNDQPDAPSSAQPSEHSGGPPSGQPVVLVHSTIQPETVCELAEQCAQAGVDLLDAPVTGGPAAAERGDLTVMLGGPAEVCDRVAPRLSDYVGLAVRVGDWGAGQRAKIARNLITYSEWLVAGEATALATAAGVEPEQLWQMIEHSDWHIGAHGGFGQLRGLLPAGDSLGSLAELVAKDLGLAAELARQLDCDPWLADKAAEQMPKLLLGE